MRGFSLCRQSYEREIYIQTHFWVWASVCALRAPDVEYLSSGVCAISQILPVGSSTSLVSIVLLSISDTTSILYTIPSFQSTPVFHFDLKFECYLLRLDLFSSKLNAVGTTAEDFTVSALLIPPSLPILDGIRVLHKRI